MRLGCALLMGIAAATTGWAQGTGAPMPGEPGFHEPELESPESVYLKPYRVEDRKKRLQDRTKERALFGVRLGATFGTFGLASYRVVSTGAFVPTGETAQFNPSLGFELGYMKETLGVSVEFEFAPVAFQSPDEETPPLLQKQGWFLLSMLSVYHRFWVNDVPMRVKLGFDLPSVSAFGYSLMGYGMCVGLHMELFTLFKKPAELYLRAHWDRVTDAAGEAIADASLHRASSRQYFAAGLQVNFF